MARVENMNWHFEPHGIDGHASGPCVHAVGALWLMYIDLEEEGWYRI